MFLLIKFIILFLTLDAHSKCGKGNTKNALVFANGMFNDQSSALISLRTTEAKFNTSYPNTKHNRTELAYNTNEKLIFQLNQVFRQKITNYKIGFLSNIFDLLKMSSETKQLFVKLMVNISQKNDKDLAKQIILYNKLIKDDYNVTTVAHSQGNFYTNFAFGSVEKPDLKEKSNLNMISVANPDNRVFNDGPYFTFESDRVISYIPGALEPNVIKEKPGFIDHGYLAHYLADEEVGSNILSQINGFFKSDSDDFLPDSKQFNIDMKPILNWYSTNLKNKKIISTSECLIAKSVHYIYFAQDMSCEEKNLAAVERSLKDCVKLFKDTPVHLNRCPFHSMHNDYIDDYRLNAETELHYEINPQCYWEYIKFEKDGLPNVEEAIKIFEKISKQQ